MSSHPHIYSTNLLLPLSRITIVVKKNDETPARTHDEQQFTEQPTNSPIDSEPPHEQQTSALPSHAPSSCDLGEVLSKALCLAGDMIGSVPINPSASSQSQDEDEVRMALNGPLFQFLQIKLHPQEPALFESMAAEGLSSATEEEKQHDDGLVVHECVVCDK